jgi:hypothetical protein
LRWLLWLLLLLVLLVLLLLMLLVLLMLLLLLMSHHLLLPEVLDMLDVQEVLLCLDEFGVVWGHAGFFQLPELL